MNKCIAVLSLSLLTFSAYGQVSIPAQPAVPAFTIPAPDGKTIISTNNVWSCTATGGLPAGLAFDGTTLTAPKISAGLLTLTGGTKYAAGQYLTSIDANGNITYTPYVPPTGGGSTALKGLISVPAVAAWGQATGTIKVAGAVVPTVSGTTVTGMGATTTIIPTGTALPNGYYFLHAWVSAPGVVSWQFIDQSGAARTAQNFLATVQ